VGTGDIDDHFPAIFFPCRMRYNWRRRRLDLPALHKFSACLDCGHLWASVDAVQLRKMIAWYGFDSALPTIFDAWRALSFIKKSLILVMILGLLWGMKAVA
jgi:hypothetical protein